MVGEFDFTKDKPAYNTKYYGSDIMNKHSCYGFSIPVQGYNAHDQQERDQKFVMKVCL